MVFSKTQKQTEHEKIHNRKATNENQIVKQNEQLTRE